MISPWWGLGLAAPVVAIKALSSFKVDKSRSAPISRQVCDMNVDMTTN